MIVLIAIISLFFTFTNFIPLSATVSIIIVFLPLLFYIKRKSVSKVSLCILILLIFFAIMTFFYDMSSLVQYDFYRRDGNVFITFAPLLILPLVHNELDINRLLRNFLKLTTVINIILIYLYFVDNIDIIKNTLPETAFMFYAHNAAGGYLSTILCLSIGLFLTKKNTTNLAMVIINGVALFLTNSRGSMIGIVFAILILILNKCFIKTRIFKNIDIVIFIISFVTIFSISFSFSEKWGSDILEEQNNEFVLPDQLNDYDNIFSKIGNRNYTIINRMCYLWPRAIDLFRNSPIIGTGFGSYDDMPYNLEIIIPNLVSTNKGNICHTDSHAHNSFLHVLCETGIIGFVLLLIVLWNIRKEIICIEDKALKLSLYLTFICIIFSSFTEHRLFTPSQVLPFTILLGLVIGNKKFVKENALNESINNE